jgi:molybdopterin molybdotransferase
MVQLADDCFAFSGPLLPIADMERLIVERITPVTEVEQVTLDDAPGRVIATDVIAPEDLPPFDNAAVDGFAVRHADLAPGAETRLVIAERVMAGHAAQPLAPNVAVRIFTGAPMPAGADTVFMQEDCRVDGDAVVLPAGLECGANRRFAGEDLPKGAVMFPAGRKLTAADVALAAAQGVTRLTVRRQLRVAVFSTGDEVVEPGAGRPPAAVFDANRHLLRGLLKKFGAVVTDLGILRDDPAALQAAIMAAAADHDLVITSGGVSTGDADHVRTAIEQAGRLVFWRVAIKPGRPVALGVLPAARPPDPVRPDLATSSDLGSPDLGSSGHTAVFAGLPGNPGAVYVTFVRVVWPLLLRLAGALPRQPIALPVRATFKYKKRKGRREYVRVSLRCADDGAVEAVKFPRDGAGVITSLTETDGLVELGEDVTVVTPGEMVGFLSHAVLTG